MTTLNAIDRQCLLDMLCREGIAAVLSELAWLQVEADLTRLPAEPEMRQKLSSVPTVLPVFSERA